MRPITCFRVAGPREAAGSERFKARPDRTNLAVLALAQFVQVFRLKELQGIWVDPVVRVHVAQALDEGVQ